jgi:hypothetical protein
LEGIIVERVVARSYFVYGCLVFALGISALLFDVSANNRYDLEHSFTGDSLSFIMSSPSIYTLGLVNFVAKLLFPGTVGILGIYLSSKIGFKGILNEEIKRIEIIFLVIFASIIMSVYFIGYNELFDKIFRRYILPYDYSIIPASIFASFAEGIGDQILNMFRISFFVWIFSKLIKTEGGRNILFWIVAAICAVIFSLEHVTASLMYQIGSYRSIFDVPFHRIMIIIGLYAPLALVCAYFLKRFGLLSAIIIHFITDISWRVLWAYIKMGGIVFM